jgi:hypothetical protein
MYFATLMFSASDSHCLLKKKILNYLNDPKIWQLKSAFFGNSIFLASMFIYLSDVFSLFLSV